MYEMTAILSAALFLMLGLCEKCKIDCNFQRRRVKRMPRRYDDLLVHESVGHRVAVDSNEAFRLHVFLPIIDCFVGEVERRFSDSSISNSHARCTGPNSQTFNFLAEG